MVPAMALQCSRCGEKYPSQYYFLAGASPAVCIRCAPALPKSERELLVAEALAAAEVEARQCLRCQSSMMPGQLAYRDAGHNGVETRVGEIRWAVARQEARLWGMLSEWVLDRDIPLYVWRCGECGYCELATPPDPRSPQGA